jgi:hypothetical protein
LTTEYTHHTGMDVENLYIDGTEVTASAAELNALHGATATAAEINALAGVTAGTAKASKALVLGTNKNVDTLSIADGGLKLGAGAGTAVTATAAELNLIKGTERISKFKVVALTADDAAGKIFSWTPGAAAIIKGLFLDVTTKPTNACTLDCGVAANATTLGDNLINGVDVATAGLYSNLVNAGTNGKAAVRCGATEYVTGSKASGASDGIVGNAIIEYVLI